MTGDLGFADHPWIRLNNEALGFAHRVVMFDIAELKGNDYDPDTLGMERLGDHTAVFEIPVLPIIADLKSRYDVDLYESNAPDINDPKLMIGGVFQDPHPDDWWNQVHRDRVLIVVAGDTPRLARAAITNTPIDMGALLAQSWIGLADGLMIRAYADGVGTQAPGQ
jgi:hypothetical protein